MIYEEKKRFLKKNGLKMHTLEVIPFPEVFFTEVSKFILLNCSFKNAHLI